METVVAKASETETVVRWWRKQRECLRGGYVGGSQCNLRGRGDSSEISGGSGGGRDG